MVRNNSSSDAVEEQAPVEDAPQDDGQLIRYTESGRAILLDPFEALAEQTEDIDLRTTPSIGDRLAEVKAPVQVRSDDIMGHDCVWLKWREQDALLVNEGTITEGYFVLAKDLTMNKYITLFVGGIALCRTLRQVNQPFRAKLEKRGRTLVFA